MALGINILKLNPSKIANINHTLANAAPIIGTKK